MYNMHIQYRSVPFCYVPFNVGVAVDAVTPTLGLLFSLIFFFLTLLSLSPSRLKRVESNGERN